MALATAVKNSRHSPQIITWSPVVDLTGATLTGTIRPMYGATQSIDGDLEIYGDGENGQVSWTYGANDVAAAASGGVFIVKLTATFGVNDKEIAMEELWVVKP